jgi:hypothetical protein
MERLSHIYDYIGNLIFIYPNALDNKNNLLKISNEQYLPMVQTLLSPTMIIILNNGRTRYYYRSIYRDKTLLVGVIFTNCIWEVRELFENPTCLFLLTLAKKGLLQALRSENEIEDNAIGDL